MDGDGQCQFGGSGQSALRPFCFSADMNVRCDVVDEQQKGEACEKANGRRYYSRGALSHIHGRDYQ